MAEPHLRRLGAVLAAPLLGAVAVVACSSGGKAPADASATDARREDHDASDAGPPHDAGFDVSPDVPHLLSLDVPPFALSPAFSPDIHDYVVRCASGDNALTVKATAATGSQVALTGPSATGAATTQDVPLTLSENQAIVLTTTLGAEAGAAGAAPAEYWVRCLPHDFPELTMKRFPSAGAVPPGYYFLGNTFKPSGDAGHGEGGYAMVLDVNGTPVWYGKTANNAGAKGTDLLAPDTISYVPIAGYTFGDYEGSFELHTVSPVGVTKVSAVGVPIDTHELRRLPNGDLLLFTDQVDLAVNLTGVPNFGPNSDTLDCIIQEVSPSGDLKWTWKASDHFDIVKENTQAATQTLKYVAGTKGAGPNDAGTVLVLDAFHCNSIDWDTVNDPDATNLLLSARNLDAIFLVHHPSDPSDGKVVWKLGGTAYNKDGAKHLTVTNDPLVNAGCGAGFFRQHHVRYALNGTITVFDDRTSCPGAARGLQLSYDVAAGSAEIVWEYDFPMQATSIGMGSFQVLSDGSHVIGWGYPPQGNPLAMTELDEKKNVLSELYFPNSPESSYRALKYPASEVDLEHLRQAIGAWSTGNGIPPDAGSDAAHDASKEAGKDAGGSRDAAMDVEAKDAGVKDAGVKDAGVKDAAAKG